MIQKFRIYLPEYREILEVSNILWTKEGIDYINTTVPTEVGDRDEFYPDGELIYLMQYTGLKDKNGVEIYEGDEIELTHSDLEGETIYSKAIAKAPMDYTLEEAVALNYAHEIELTGKNIYENPELLEVAE